MMTRAPAPLVALACLLVAGCGRAPPENPPPRCDDKVCTTDNGDGTLLTVIDASHDTEFVPFDFETAGQVDDDDPAWDLAAQSYRLKTNGGVSGGGGVQIAIVLEEDWDTFEQAPADAEWLEDESGQAAFGAPGDEAYAFLQDGAWYDYELATHTVTPKSDGRFYVVKSTDGLYYKLRMDGFYDAEGAGRTPHFSWSAIFAP